MNRRNQAGWFAVIATLGLFGCGPGEPDREIPDDAERCVAEEDSGGALEARAVALGVGGAGSFRSFQDGEEAELVGGFQGGYMITPAVRVEAAGDSRDEACFQVHLENALMEGGEVVPGALVNATFTRSGGFFYVDSLYDLLGFEPGSLQGKTLLLSATVSGVGFEGTQAVSIRLK